MYSARLCSWLLALGSWLLALGPATPLQRCSDGIRVVRAYIADAPGAARWSDHRGAFWGLRFRAVVPPERRRCCRPLLAVQPGPSQMSSESFQNRQSQILLLTKAGQPSKQSTPELCTQDHEQSGWLVRSLVQQCYILGFK